MKEDAKIYQNNINTISLPLNFKNIPKELQVIGWGLTEYNNPSNVLLQTNLNFVALDNCTKYVDLLLTDGMQFCDIRSENRDSYKGKKRK